MKHILGLFAILGAGLLPAFAQSAAELNAAVSGGNTALTVDFSRPPDASEITLWDGKVLPPIIIGQGNDAAVRRAAGDLAEDFGRVTGKRAEEDTTNPKPAGVCLIIGTLGRDPVIDALVASQKLNVTGVSGQWESYVLEVVQNPLPGGGQALVIAGSDRRGTIYGIYQLSEMIGVSPWYWWADVPVRKQRFIGLHGSRLVQGPPAVKYRGIFLNDEDWGLRPWAAKTWDPQTRNIGPKTYAAVFELLLRLRANYLWPAMHPGTAAFNFFPENKKLADRFGIVMGSSHCEQMLRDNVSEWDKPRFGDYNFVTNPRGVLDYWEQRVQENRKFESIYTVGMRGIHDGGMPGGGNDLEKAGRLETIIADQRRMLARWVDPDVTRVPQIFCPYKEVLPLYRLMTRLPDDITLLWPDDNYGYIREFSDARERRRSGGAGVYYHVSYWGQPRDYLWLCSTPPALIAEEMSKAYEYGADKVWMLNVGDLKPAELDIEFFLKLAWNPHAWNGGNTYDLLEQQLARDFGEANAPELTGILAEYYRLNFQRKPEHMALPASPSFSAEEAAGRLAAWRALTSRVEAVGEKLPADARDSFFELVAYPVRAAALANERALSVAAAKSAQDQIHELTDIYNHKIAGGKWCYMMSDNPRGQLERKVVSAAAPPPGLGQPATLAAQTIGTAAHLSDVDFLEAGHRVVMDAADASAMVPGREAHWSKINGLGYQGVAVTVFPATASVCATTGIILAVSPCLQYKVWLQEAGDWRVTVRALPTFSVEAGRPQRYAIAFDDAPPQVVALPYSLDEQDPQWQQDVLRNSALTTSRHVIQAPGRHILKIWMVDPGIVLDAIAAAPGGVAQTGYFWQPETRAPKLN